MNKLSYLLIAAVATLAVSSCSTTDKDNFSRARYRQHHKLVKVNKERQAPVVVQNHTQSKEHVVVPNEATLVETGQQATAIAKNNEKDVKVRNTTTAKQKTASRKYSVNKRKARTDNAYKVADKTDFIAPVSSGIASESQPAYDDVLIIILCILLPPVAVGLVLGWGSNEFLISLILTILFWIPGVIYALIVTR